MSLKNITIQEKRIAWKVLDAMQDELTTNDELSLQTILNGFNYIQELKNQVDVRTIKQKIPTESVLPYTQGQEEIKMSSLQPFKNSLRALLGKRQLATSATKR